MAFQIGKNCRIHPSVVINVKDGYLGDGALVLEGARLEGTRVEIGREAYIDRGATIGGGSCFDPCASLKAGDWFHMGVNSQINIARGVKVGHEFGCGIETKIFTHGAWIDSYNLGAPVQWGPFEAGDSVWLPNAWVNPGVTIGSNVVVAARSLINRSLPSGCLAAGSPVQIIKENCYPRKLGVEQKLELIKTIISDAWLRYSVDHRDEQQATWKLEDDLLVFDDFRFDLKGKVISGKANDWAIILKDQLRRNGIRFRYEPQAGNWSPWQS
jgi:acetyltransferase-like isoleucine patch superfamily enzyme